MGRLVAASIALSLIAGCASTKARVQDALENVGLDRQEQHKAVEEGKEAALAPGRHGSAGMYVAAGANPHFHGAGGEIGGVYNDYWWEAKAGLAMYLSGSGRGLFVGPTAAIHLQLPTRLSPFAGVGVFAGYSERDTGQWDENGEAKVIDEGFASVYPEVGVNFWLADKIRLTTSATYQITTEGRRHDFWTVGGGIAVLFPTGN